RLTRCIWPLAGYWPFPLFSAAIGCGHWLASGQPITLTGITSIFWWPVAGKWLASGHFLFTSGEPVKHDLRRLLFAFGPYQRDHQPQKPHPQQDMPTGPPNDITQY